MPKRKYDNLTGGTGDINPQILRAKATQASADAFKSQEIDIPRPLYSTGKQPLLMEILKVKMYWNYPTAFTVPKTDGQNLIAFLSTTNLAAEIGPDDGRFICGINKKIAVTTSGVFNEMWPMELDLTDGVGHGYLVALDKIYLNIDSSATAAANQGIAEIWYRWKSVPLLDFIGIQNSQINAQ